MPRSFAAWSPFVVAASLSFASVGHGADPPAEPARARAARAPVPLDGIAAIVGDVTIFRSDIAARVRMFEQKLSKDPLQRRAEMVTLGKEILTHLIEEKLIEKDAEKLHIEASDADVAAGIAAVAQNNNLDKKQLEVEVVKMGYTMGQYRDEIRRQIVEQRWIMVRAGGKIDRKKTPDAASFQAAFDKQRGLLVAELRSRSFIEIR